MNTLMSLDIKVNYNYCTHSKNILVTFISRGLKYVVVKSPGEIYMSVEKTLFFCVWRDRV